MPTLQRGVHLIWRLVWSVLAVVVGAVVVVGVVGVIFGGAEGWERVVWVSVGVAVLAFLLVVWVMHRFVRSQARALTGAFEKALPRGIARGGVETSNGRWPDLDRVAEGLARSFGEMLEQASRDKGRLETVIAAMSDGVVAVDRQQRVLLANAAAEQLLGVKISEALEKPLWEFIKVEGVMTAASEVMLTGQARTIAAGPFRAKFLEVTVRRLADRTGLVIVARDVTEAQRYQRMREEFVANVSHELRTPISVIKGYVETLRDGAMEDRERAKTYLETVGRHADQLTNLVNDILDLSRLEGGDVIAMKDRVDVGAAAGRVGELMRPAAEQKRQTFSVEAGPGLVMTGNAEYLERAIGNLVENAIKYTPEGGRVLVRVEGADGRVVVSVEDSGIGIGAEDLPRIFERFYRADRSRSREMGGTGLGLSIVKHVVQGHGGKVEVASTVGVGSNFVMSFPAANVGAGEAASHDLHNTG